MKKLLLTLIPALTSLSFFMMFSGCGVAKVSPATHNAFKSHQKMYTQRNMFISIGRFGQPHIETTNYGVGQKIPVNSLITYKDMNSKEVSFMYQGKPVTLSNNKKYTKLNIADMLDRYFSKEAINLDAFSPYEKDAIKLGLIKKGMSKDAVLVSRGYPPAHKTASTELDTWKYWKHKYDKSVMYVNFEDNRVTSITQE